MYRFAALTAFILGSAASAFAAAPVAETRAAEPGKACEGFGPNFFSATLVPACIKLGAELRAGFGKDFAPRDIALVSQRLPTVADPNGGVPMLFYYLKDFRDRTRTIRPVLDGQVNFTAVAATDYGPVSVYANVRGTLEYIQNSHPRFETNSTTRGAVQNVVDQAWVKFAGFTAGIYPSFFNFTQAGYSFSGAYSSSRKTPILGYSYRFSDYAVASLSLEDPNRRRTQDGLLASYANVRAPDVVGQFRFGNSATLFQIAGAWHQIRDHAASNCCAAPVSTKTGWAVSAGGEYRTKWSDVFGEQAGDMYGRFMLTGAYTSGALSYLGMPYFALDYVAEANGRLHLTRGYSTVASYEHLWNPSLKSTLTWSAYRASMHSDLSDILNGNLVNFGYRVRGQALQFSTEYMIRPDLMVGGEVSQYHDKATGTFSGIAGAAAKVTNYNLLAYVRKLY